MTDRELLELAAKAAGIDVVPYTWNKGTGWDHEGFTVAGAGPDEWNPREDDGDAFRLAATLGMSIEQNHIGSAVMVNNTSREKYVDHGGDPCAATRFAVTRAAAEIGRAM